MDKVLVVVVTRNNSVLLQNMFDSFAKYDPGFPCDFLIVDHQSTDENQQIVLERLAKKHRIVIYENDRVEVSFNRAYQENQDYSFYFFLHDDSAANKNGWLKVFVDRMNSGYFEKIIENTHYKDLPIMRVGALHQPYRSYTSILGYPVQCVFLEPALKVLNKDIPSIFKYCDSDRVLVKKQCLQMSFGVPNLDNFKKIEKDNPKTFELLCETLNKYLYYRDEGVPPLEKYPSDFFWRKILLLSEFLNSIEPLNCGFRTVGLEGDGCLEAIDGYDEPWGHNFIHHFGAPNMCEFLAKKFNTDAKEIKKQFNNKIFLLKAEKLIKEYFERKIND
ncbi:MAG: glycosyltransferase family A protein [Candidatus Parcubacteria bacterium]|nr:glycosyltransferase family A protein [Candidatus Parcubacteria bacterium]